MFALECAMDELAYALKMDPLELRLSTTPRRDPNEDLPFSSKALRECYELGAERFGWSKRKPEPRSMRDGRWLVGWGMATATYLAMQHPGRRRPSDRSARRHGARRQRDAADIGTGTYTAMTHSPPMRWGSRSRSEVRARRQPAAEGPALEGGSMTDGERGTAVQGAAMAVAAQAARARQRATPPRRCTAPRRRTSSSPTASCTRRRDAARARDGRRRDAAQRHDRVDGDVELVPSKDREKYSMLAHGASVRRGEGRRRPRHRPRHARRRARRRPAGSSTRRPRTARRSGGVVWGIGMALTEETAIDHRYGRIMNADLAALPRAGERRLHEIETMFVERTTGRQPARREGHGRDRHRRVAAAIANAVFHATGKRVRDLPITPDKLL